MTDAHDDDQHAHVEDASDDPIVAETILPVLAERVIAQRFADAAWRFE